MMSFRNRTELERPGARRSMLVGLILVCGLSLVGLERSEVLEDLGSPALAGTSEPVVRGVESQESGRRVARPEAVAVSAAVGPALADDSCPASGCSKAQSKLELKFQGAVEIGVEVRRRS